MATGTRRGSGQQSSKPGKSSSSTSRPTNRPDNTRGARDAAGVSEKPPVGRLRKYLKGERSELDTTDPTKPEGRLVDPDAASWYVPTGREPWLKKRSGMRARDVKSGDVGRFKLADFTTRASDERGHDKSLKVAMPPQMLNELAALVESRVYPTRSAEGLARTLIYEGMMMLHEIAKQDGLIIPNSHMQHLEALAVMNRNTLSIIAYDDMLAQSCDLVRDLQRRGVRNKARATVYEMLSIIERIESSELRDRWLADIKEEFGGLLRGRPAKTRARIKVEPVEEEDDREDFSPDFDDDDES